MLQRLVVLTVVLLLPHAAFADYESTAEDKLWDAYAALLEQAIAANPQPEIDDIYYDLSPWRIPDAQLDALEPEFGDDPRYWELRWWNDQGKNPDWLRLGAALGTIAFAGAAQLYWSDVEAQYRLLDRIVEGQATAEDQENLHQLDWSDEPWKDFERARKDSLDALIAAYPDEAWPRYRRALLHFEYGQWEAGLDALRAGNAAPNNRYPAVFPWSYVAARQASELPQTHAAAAGAVLLHSHVMPYENVVRIKDHTRDQLVRWSMGASFNEFEPWHSYLCRLGMAEGAPDIFMLVALTSHNLLARYWLIDAPESLTRDQREGLFNLHMLMREPRNVFTHSLDGFEDWLATARSAGTVEPVLQANAAYLSTQSERSARAARLFSRCGGFDWTTFQLPPRESTRLQAATTGN